MFKPFPIRSRFGHWLSALCLLALVPSALAEEVTHFNIPSQDLGSALTTFARQSQQQLLFAPDIVAGKTATAVQGDLEPQEALQRLIKGAGLTYTMTESGAILLKPLAPAAAPAPKKESSARGVEEVMVTARKSVESAQDVPIALTSMSAAKLDDYAVTGFADIRSVAPNLNIQPWPFDSQTLTVAMRGQKQTQVQLTLDQSVGIYVDGFYYSRPMGLGGALVDTNRVEVLRGPQGTLYGRNTTGGTVSIYTADPVDELAGSLDVKAGNYNARSATGVFNLPISDDAGLRFVAQQSERDGYAETPSGHEIDDEDLKYFRGKFKGQLTDRLALTFSAAYTHSENGGAQVKLAGITGTGPAVTEAAAELAGVTRVTPANLALVAAQVPAAIAALQSWADGDYSRVGNNTETYSIFEGSQYMASLDYELADRLMLKSISGYHEFKRDARADYDGSPFQINSPHPFMDDEYFSQEFQLLGNLTDLDWVAGLYYSRENGSGSNTGSPTLPALTGANAYNFSNHDVLNTSSAAYFQSNWAFIPDWRLTTGVRYSTDERDITLDNQTAGVCLVPAPGSASTISGASQCPRSFSDTYESPSWLVSLDHQLNDSLMIYTKVAKGYRAGGQNQNGQIYAEAFEDFDPEVVTEYEVGFKSDLFDNLVRLNMAIYYADYTDIQRTITLPTFEGGLANRTDNAAAATVQGFETELTWYVTDDLTIDAWAGYTDAKYDDYEVLGVDRSGEAFPIPDWTSSISGRYVRPVALGEIRLNAGYYWQSETDFSLGSSRPEFTTQDAYGLWRAKATLVLSNSDIEISVFGRNLTDKKHFVDATSATDTLGIANLIPGEPRVFGLEIKKLWGKL